MAPKKQAKKKKTAKKVKDPNKIGLFDHVNAVKAVQDPKYFDKISEENQKTWSNWMVLRALSMNDDYLPIVNELQKYMNLTPKLMYKVLIDIFPKRQTYDKFINGKKEGKHVEWLQELVKKDLSVSMNEAGDYLDIFMLTTEGKESLLGLCQRYSIDEKEIKKLKLKV
jgi:hypothetical protein